MEVRHINSCMQYNFAKQNSNPIFKGNIKKEIISQKVIDKFGLNMTTRVGYDGPPNYVQAPDNLPFGLTEFFRRLEINWETHVDKNTHKSSLLSNS